MQEKYPQKDGDRYYVFYVEDMGEGNPKLKFSIDEENNTGIVLPSGRTVHNLDDIDPGMIKALDVSRDESNPSIGKVYMILSEENTVVEQIANSSTNQGDVFTIVEEQPEFPGGSTELYKIIGERLEYPAKAREMGIEGRVFIQFIIDENGQVTDAKPVKGIGAGCDEAAAKVISELPAFIPGKQRGKNVKVRMVLPVVFTLDGDEPKTDANSSMIIEIPEGN
jgi:TonB family protein